MEELDPNKLRDVQIKRLAELVEVAYRNSTDEGLRMKTREDWFQKYTNAVLALNQLLKDSQYKDYEKRLKALEESGLRFKRLAWRRVPSNMPVPRSRGRVRGSRLRGPSRSR